VHQLSAHAGWSDLPAVRAGPVYAANANAYFARPGPRVVEGTALLAQLLHPTLFGWSAPEQAYQQLIIQQVFAPLISPAPCAT